MRLHTVATVLTALAVVFAVTSPVAAGSISLTSVSSPDSVVQGDSFTVDVSVSGSNVQGNQIDVSLSLPSGLSCDQTTQTVSPGGTASFSCTGDSAGDYTGEISISATATDSGDGSTLTASDQTGLTVLTPASLSMTTSLPDSTITVGKSTTYTVVINNVGDASTTYSLSLAGSSGYSTSVTSGSTSGTIDGGTTASITYSVSGDGSGTHALDPTVNGGNGQTLTESDSITVNAPTTPTPTPSGDGGAGVGAGTPGPGPQTTDVAEVATTNGEAEVSISQISADDPVSVSIDDVQTESVAVTEVEADFSTSTESDTSMSVSANTDRPSGTADAPTDTVVGYVSVDVADNLEDDVSEGTFEVDISDADVPAEDVVAYRYHDDSWNQVQTDVVDSTTIRITSPGYSAFALGVFGSTPIELQTPTAAPITPAETPSAPAPTPASTPTQTDATSVPTQTASPVSSPTPGASGPGFTLGITVLALLSMLALREQL